MRPVLRGTMAALAVAGVSLVAQRAPSGQRPAAPVNASPRVRPAPPANRYADPALCETCHAGIAATFHKTGMGRSFYRLTPATAVEDFTPDRPYYHAASGTYLAMIERGGRYYQRRWQKGPDGGEINVDEKLVDFVMGSGNHGRTYLHLTARNTLQELPLGWYTEKGGYWAMAPGFDRPDYPGSTRAITYECMFCHDAYPKIPKGHDEAGARPEFTLPIPDQGIDCQRCHGPGQNHVDTASRPGATAQQIRGSIVNPKRLPPAREFEVCMQCHLETTTTTLPHDLQRPERAPFSYIPGQPLGDFRLTFDRAGGMGDRFEVAHAAYRMRLSPCFLKSGGDSAAGKLRCTTCHDPHNIPRGEAAAVHYNAICRTCHAAAFQSAVASGSHTSATGCIDCHMPKRRTDDGVHVVMTDHYIRARQPPGDLLAEKPEIHETTATSYRGEVTPYYPRDLAATTTPAAQKDEERELYLAVAQIAERSNLKEGLPKLESLIAKYHPARADFYADLGEGFSAAGLPGRAVPYLEQAAARAPGSAVVLRKLGSAQMDAGQLGGAEATLRRAVSLAPEDAGAWGILAEVLMKERRAAEAKAAFASGIAADPELPDLHSSLAELLLATGDLAGSEREFREALRIQPGVARVEANLASVLASRGALPEARFHFEQSLHLNPDFTPARLNYARLLAASGAPGDAEKQLQAALAADAGQADAHELLGWLMADRGDNEGAERELLAATRLRSGFGRAEYELGVVLSRKGDFAGARAHLKIAAGSSDPQARASAAELAATLPR